jgi:peroxiredoxin Q/BCP
MRIGSLVLVLLAMCMQATVIRAEPAVGDAAPNVEFQGSDGKAYKLADYKDKQAVVIAWFPRAFTGGCTTECSSLRVGPITEGFTVSLLGGRTAEIAPSQGSGLDKFDVAFFTASCDDAETNARFAQALKLDYPILSDPSRAAAKAFGVVDDARPAAQRWTFYIGKDGKVLFVDKEMNTTNHGQEIAKKLEELGISRK